MRYLTGILVLAVLAILIGAGCERKIVNEVVAEPPPGTTAACFTCHNDSDFGFALLAARQGYEQSKHGTGDTYGRNRLNSSRYQACEKCHTNEGFVAAVTGVPASGESFSRIGCFTCHKPHTSGSLQLRWTSAVTIADGTIFNMGEGNLCARCHQARENVNTYVKDSLILTERFGPHHSTQADLLLGTNGYEYDGYEYESGGHQSAEDGCLHCHMAPSVYATGGHTFYLEDEANEYENVKGCNTCHGGGVDELNYEGKQTEVAGLLDHLGDLLVNAGLMTWIDEGGEMVLLPTDSALAETAEQAGAVFNFLYVHDDGSLGIHNPDYAVGLLESSIEYLEGAKAPTRVHDGPIAAH